MSSFIDKLKTQLGSYFAKEEDLATIATTGDYNDLINAPQGGGGGSDNIIEVVVSYEDIITAAPSDYLNAAQAGNIGEFSITVLGSSNTLIYPIAYRMPDPSKIIYYYNNVTQYTGEMMLTMFAEYNNHYHSFQIDSFNISLDQKTYYAGSSSNQTQEMEIKP